MAQVRVQHRERLDERTNALSEIHDLKELDRRAERKIRKSLEDENNEQKTTTQHGQ